MAATLQSKSSGRITLVIITKIITNKKCVVRNCLVIISARGRTLLRDQKCRNALPIHTTICNNMFIDYCKQIVLT